MIAANSASEFGSLPLRIGDIDAAKSGGIDTPLMLGCSPVDGGSLPVVDALFDALPRDDAREPDSFGEVVDAEAREAAAARCCACCNCLLATVSRLFFAGEGPQTWLFIYVTNQPSHLGLVEDGCERLGGRSNENWFMSKGGEGA